MLMGLLGNHGPWLAMLALMAARGLWLASSTAALSAAPASSPPRSPPSLPETEKTRSQARLARQ